MSLSLYTQSGMAPSRDHKAQHEKLAAMMPVLRTAEARMPAEKVVEGELLEKDLNHDSGADYFFKRRLFENEVDTSSSHLPQTLSYYAVNAYLANQGLGMSYLTKSAQVIDYYV